MSVFAALLITLVAVAMGAPATAQNKVVVYSANDGNLDRFVFDAFTKETGIAGASTEGIRGEKQEPLGLAAGPPPITNFGISAILAISLIHDQFIRFCISDHQITCDPPITRFFAPTPAFLHLSLQTKPLIQFDPRVTLA